MDSDAANVVWTVGHSNRTAQAFLELLVAVGIEQIVDVRRFPGSRKWPHFSGEALAANLKGEGIEYLHVPTLGGRRGTPAAESPNTAWRVKSFAAYADYMRTPEFKAGLAELERVARQRRTAMMCSEAVPWRCHRRLIADALMVRAWEVRDILSEKRAERREMTRFAQVREGEVVYPGGTEAEE